MKTHRLMLVGHCPTKKNAKHAWKGRVIIDPAIKAQVQVLEWRARSIWGARKPLPSAIVHARFFVRDGRADLDGKYTTIQDVLVKAGVLANDSIARIKRVSMAAEYDENERVEIRLREVA